MGIVLDFLISGSFWKSCLGMGSSQYMMLKENNFSRMVMAD